MATQKLFFMDNTKVNIYKSKIVTTKSGRTQMVLGATFLGVQ
jgi:hypothetical protein